MISDETAQAIWGRILAEEIQSPGSISNRTLDIIRNLSKYEAATFNKACSLIAFDKYLVDNKKGDSIKPEEYAALRDSGLIASYTNGIYRSSKWIDTTITMPDGTKVLAYYIRIKNLFIFQKKIEGQPIEAPTFSYWELTAAAMELYKIIKIDPLEKVHDIKNTLIKEDSKGDVFFTTYTDLEKQLVDLENIRKL
ncbi:hypothetical protein O162_09110 [Pseudomonas putida SJ3]|nr:hypothetical protein O162_09110 [Pseudomonas putida SJ3]